LALGAGGLDPKVLGLVLLAVVELTEVVLLSLVDDGQDTGNTLADGVAKPERGKREISGPSSMTMPFHMGHNKW